MKCSKKVVAFTLAATMMLGSTMGVFAANTDDTDKDYDASENKITFTTGGGLDPTLPVDPEDPDEDITPDPDGKEDPTGNIGELRLDVVPQFDFGSHQITTSNKSYFAELPIDGSTEEEIPYYVQVTDVSGTGEGWSLRAKMTTQFTDGTNSLNGAVIKLNNVTSAAQEGTTPPSTTTDRELKYDEVTDTTVVLAVAEANEGMGVSVVRFGDTARYGNEMTADESVQLVIPDNTQVYKTEYKATIKWTLGAIPE